MVEESENPTILPDQAAFDHCDYVTNGRIGTAVPPCRPAERNDRLWSRRAIFVEEKVIDVILGHHASTLQEEALSGCLSAENDR